MPLFKVGSVSHLSVSILRNSAFLYRLFFLYNFAPKKESKTGKNNIKVMKNILVLQNWLERIRKEVTNKVLSIKRISVFLNFPILAQPTLKKI